MANIFLYLQKGLTRSKLTQNSRQMVKFQAFRPKPVFELAHPYIGFLHILVFFEISKPEIRGFWGDFSGNFHVFKLVLHD